MDKNIKTETRPFCGCGLSKTFPFCDSSQMISRSREPGKLESCGAAAPAKQAQAQPESTDA